MKIFNATNSSVDLPWTGGRLNIPPRSFSIDFLGDVNLVKLIVTTFTPEQIALLVCGPYELSMCAGATTSAVNYVVQSTDEVVKRFGLKLGEKKEAEEKKEVEMPLHEHKPNKAEKKCDECCEEKCCNGEVDNTEPTPEPEVEPAPEPEPTPESEPAPKKKKSTKKTKKAKEEE